MKFDVATQREDMLRFQLPIISRFDPDAGPRAGQPSQLLFNVASLTKCYWLGLGDEAKPHLLRIIRWMIDRTPPPLALWPRDDANPLAGATAHYEWWLALGTSRWLCGMTCEGDFARALEAYTAGDDILLRDQLEQARVDRQERLSELLAVAIAANLPRVGALLYESVGLTDGDPLVRPVVDFGQWACGQLERGQGHDGELVAAGRRMLRVALLPYFRATSRWIEPSLWLKAIYFDSEVAKTAEETLLRAYDLMPGIVRPEVVPRS